MQVKSLLYGMVESLEACNYHWKVAKFRPDSIKTIQTRYPAIYRKVYEDLLDAGTNNRSVFGNEYRLEGGLQLQQRPSEFAALITMLISRRPFSNYLEIGAASGGTCCMLNRYLAPEKIFVIDNGSHVDTRSLATNLPPEKTIRFTGDSHSAEAATFLKTHLDGLVDLAFIDGDHSYLGVWQDLATVCIFSRIGTLFVFHDIVVTGVRRCWREAVSGGLLKPIGVFVDQYHPLGLGLAEFMGRS